MIYGYARCSTNEDKQDITRQIRELNALGADKENIYLEYASGTKADREHLKRLLDTVEKGDTIISTEVSRITRSNKHLCEIIEVAKEKQIKLIFGNFIVDCIGELDPMTEGMLKMMGVFSELERNMIAARVKSGLRNAKENGKKLGRPKTREEDIPKEFLKYYSKYAAKDISKSEFARLSGLHRNTIAKYIKILENR